MFGNKFHPVNSVFSVILKASSGHHKMPYKVTNQKGRGMLAYSRQPLPRKQYSSRVHSTLDTNFVNDDCV